MPAARHRSRSLVIACAVIATMRMCWPVSRSRCRIATVASRPPMTGICRSISTRSKVSRSSRASASRPFWATVT